jgi:hypothetical protein
MIALRVTRHAAPCTVALNCGKMNVAETMPMSDYLSPRQNPAVLLPDRSGASQQRKQDCGILY